jgi:ATP-dependent exoDNAse (exonuclease V) alpha subunit
MIKEHDRVVLLKDIPEQGLKAGDVGTVVHVYRHGEAFEVEFMTLDGRTVAIVTLPALHVRTVSSMDITHVRELIST